jgi:ribosomal protein L31
MDIVGWPSPLKDLGYKLARVEPVVQNDDGEKVNPDLIFSSNRLLHVIVTECKGGNKTTQEQVDDQIKRYRRISQENLRDIVSIYDPRRLTHDLSLACKQGIDAELYGYKLPILVFSDDTIQKQNDFTNITLNSAFCNDIPINNQPPLSLYPFSDIDPDPIIALDVFTALLTMSLSGPDPIEINVEQIASECHPLWRSISLGQQKKLFTKIDSIVSRYQRNELRGYIARISSRGDWRITRTIEAFRKKCQGIIDKLDNEPSPGELGDYFELY